KVLRCWRVGEGFAGFMWARCGEKGHTRDSNRPLPNPMKLARARAEAAERERASQADRLRVAQRLWSWRRPVSRSPVETYLRGPRAYDGPIPGTLGYLPPRDEYP